jgi:predicted DCC family thiol-disulfide oxidoreductase YuxK
LQWVEKKLVLEAIAYQSADLDSFGLTFQECTEAVHVIHHGNTYRGSDAIAYLLRERKNRILSRVIKLSGPLARYGYTWVAGHRNSWIIRLATKMVERSL